MEINKIYTGEALEVLKTFPSDSIDCSISSPPYWGLRDYGNENQLGQEKHFNEYIDKLEAIYLEVFRVLKPTGTVFINLGDTYGTKSGRMGTKIIEPKYGHDNTRSFKQPNIKMHKSLCMIPDRFAIRMIDNGLILRNHIIWRKPNQMPQSVKDRFTVDFESVFFFTKNTKYYFDQIKEPTIQKDDGVRTRINDKINATPGQTKHGNLKVNNYDTKNIRAVWDISTQPRKDTHFACYPDKLVERMLCGCPEGGIILDPFFGRGTTGIVAKRNKRNYIGIEINPEYVSLAEKNLNGI